MGHKTTAEEVVDLRAAIREGHELLSDLRAAQRDLRGLLAEVNEAAGKVFEERMTEQVAAGLKGYHDSIQQAIEDTSEAVDRRFDTVTTILLGEGHKNKGESIPEIARRIAAERQS